MHVRERARPTVPEDDSMKDVTMDGGDEVGKSRQSNGVASEEVQKLREANLELYRYAVKNILNGDG